MSSSLHALLVTPSASGTRNGNRITALRIAAMLRTLGHYVRVRERDDGAPADLLVAVHARKSAHAVTAYTGRDPGGRIVVVLAGTDVYPKLDGDPETTACLERAHRIVALQPLALTVLPERLREKGTVILQSAEAVRRAEPDPDYFDVCLVANLREVKDPLLAAEAVALLPPGSRVRVLHVGGTIDEELGRAARAASDYGDRYRWLGPLPRRDTRQLLAASRLALLTSKDEGGANVVSEALAAGVPVVSTDIPGTTGILGADYPGLFPVGDAQALADLLHRVETDAAFEKRLEQRCREAAPQVDPRLEQQAWGRLLTEMFPGTLSRP